MEAKSHKINHKSNVSSISFKIEKAEYKDEHTTIIVKVKQKQNFSYNISLTDIYILPSNHYVDTIRGKLINWNNHKNPNPSNIPVSDENEELLILSFPGDVITDNPAFDLKIGNIMDRKKTELLFKDIPFSR